MAASGGGLPRVAASGKQRTPKEEPKRRAGGVRSRRAPTPAAALCPTLHALRAVPAAPQMYEIFGKYGAIRQVGEYSRRHGCIKGGGML